jgi:creatinine amidohydrolase/Fe(II)-dependent formamide hydrolase-like protein
MARARPDYGHLADAPAGVLYQPSVFRGDPGAGIDWSATGVRGDPTLATAEKGRAILAAIVQDIVAAIRQTYPGAIEAAP